jgi:hypothetical protein
MPALKLGRRPALIPAGLRELPFYAAGPLPSAPPAVTVPMISDWGVLGNAQYEDCGVAGLQHGFMACAAALREPAVSISEDQVVSYYLTYDGGRDNGVVLSQYLQYVHVTGYYSQRVTAYAPVNVNDLSTLQFTIDAYDFAYTGITMTQAMMDAFNAGQRPWDLVMTQGQALGGHCVPLVGYDSLYLYAVTWGEIQPIAYAAWNRVADEAWAVITGSDQSAGTAGRGISLAALQADLSRLS